MFTQEVKLYLVISSMRKRHDLCYDFIKMSVSSAKYLKSRLFKDARI